MVIDSMMKEIKKFCKDDDTCIFVILVLIGFLLCMFFNRDEGFASLDYSSINESENEQGKHDNGIGQEPTNKRYNADEGPATAEPPKGPADPTMPQIAKGEELPGLQPKNPGDPVNGRGPLEGPVQLARQGQQYPSQVLPNTGGISVKGFSLDSGNMGVPMTYSAYTPYAKFKDGPPSDLGPAFPSGEPDVLPVAPAAPAAPAAQAPVETVQAQPAQEAVPQSDKSMKLVLFYAPWCGHSSRMLEGYDAVISKYDNQTMNGITLSIIKIDMDANKEGAKPYDVEIKGFPTLYTFVYDNGKLISQPFSPRDEDEIVAELQKRTQLIGSQ
jgi:thiol-disulfide isomerase/thioredoxin